MGGRMGRGPQAGVPKRTAAMRPLLTGRSHDAIMGRPRFREVDRKQCHIRAPARCACTQTDRYPRRRHRPRMDGPENYDQHVCRSASRTLRRGLMTSNFATRRTHRRKIMSSSTAAHRSASNGPPRIQAGLSRLCPASRSRQGRTSSTSSSTGAGSTSTMWRSDVDRSCAGGCVAGPASAKSRIRTSLRGGSGCPGGRRGRGGAKK